MSNRWMLLLVLGTLLVGAPAVGLCGDAKAGSDVDLSSVYVADRVAGAHRISIRGTLGGSATVQLDPNTCAVNEFGDPTICTRMAARSIPVQLKQAKLADPAGKGRRLFLIAGMPQPEGRTYPKYFLVAPKRGLGGFRLIELSGPDKRRTLALESASPVVKERPAQRLCRNVTYRATQRGTTGNLTAVGTHRSAGWDARFELLPIWSFPPQFKLICIPPKGMAAQILVPFEVSRAFKSDELIQTLVVHDGDGKHEVSVTQLK